MAAFQENHSDLNAVRALHLAAFSSGGEADLVDALRKSGDAVISLVAKDGGKVTGHILFSRLEAPMRALALAPVAVLPAYQKKGIGSLLIREGLRRAEKEGWQSVFVLGNPAYYVRFGFDVRAAQDYDCVYAGPYFMALHLVDHHFRSGIITYPAPFQNI